MAKSVAPKVKMATATIKVPKAATNKKPATIKFPAPKNVSDKPQPVSKGLAAYFGANY